MWNQNVIIFLVREKFISFLKYIFIHIYMYMYTKAFLLHLIKAWERTSKRDGEIGKQTKLNGSAEYEIEKVKQTR